MLLKLIEKEHTKNISSAKLTDADSENSETQVWIDFSYSCEYINLVQQDNLITKSLEVGKLINFMIANPEKFGVKKL